jgi:hypothetical protein
MFGLFKHKGHRIPVHILQAPAAVRCNELDKAMYCAYRSGCTCTDRRRFKICTNKSVMYVYGHE